MNHLNQRKSPSASLVSKEIETDFFRRRFSRSRKKFPKGREFRCITGAHIKSKISILRNQYVKSNAFWVSHPLVGALMCPSKRGSSSSSAESLASSGKDMLEATLLHLNSALRIFFFFNSFSNALNSRRPLLLLAKRANRQRTNGPVRVRFCS